MTGRTKRWLSSGVVLVLMIFLWLGFRSRNQFGPPLVLPDGSSIRVVSMTYGTNHECGSALARLVHRLPPFGQKVAKGVFGSEALAWAGYIGNERPAFVVWVQYSPGPGMLPITPGSVLGWLEDGSGYSSANGSGLVSPAQPFSFGVYQAVPRRDKEISVRLIGNGPSGSTNLGAIRFTNPFWGEFPQWEPETLPTTKRDGDLEVGLTAFVTGLGSWHRIANAADGGRDLVLDAKRRDGRSYSLIVLDVKSSVNSNQQWRLRDAILSDATGNWVDVRMKSSPEESEGWYYFDHSLWPSENAWRVDLELCRIGGFSPSELLTFRSVPLGEFNAAKNLGWSSNIAGGNVTLKSLLRRMPVSTNVNSISDLSVIELTVGLPTNVWLNLHGVRFNTGQTNMFLPAGDGTWMRSQRQTRNYLLNPALEAVSVDLTYTVQTTRWVHFLVKPEVGRKTIKLPSPRP